MASIQRKGKSIYVVYNVLNPSLGIKKPFWEKVENEEIAKVRKEEVELQDAKKTLKMPNFENVEEYLNTFIEIYGSQNWSPGTYGTNVTNIKTYIIPLIGKIKMREFTSLHADRFIKELYSVRQIRNKKKTLTLSQIEKVGKLLKTAFNQAEIWELIDKNPFRFTKLPKPEEKEREIWSQESLVNVLNKCEDALLYTIINLAFSTTFRIGEILGLTWNYVNISDEDIDRDDAHLIINQQLQRVNKEDAKSSNKFEVIFEFPTLVIRKTKTALMLIKPKTKGSRRKVWLPRTVAYILREWHKIQLEDKAIFGSDYNDYNLVFGNSLGNPITEDIINKKFKRFLVDNDFPVVDLHSLRHLSITYKLKLNHGDLKSTQADAGHSTPDMIMKRYAHVVDEDRKIHAAKFEEAFYDNLKNSSQNESEIESKEDNQLNEFLELLSKDKSLLKEFSQLLKK